MMDEDFEEDGLRSDHWISATDLMGGALIIFFLLLMQFVLTGDEDSDRGEQLEVARAAAVEQEARAAAAAREAEQLSAGLRKMQQELQDAKIQVQNVKEVAVTYDQKRQDLYEDLLTEFSGDLPRWNAVILKDLTIRFNEPNVHFPVGSAEIRTPFKRILEDFFPRYIRTVTKDAYREGIAEVRIEGHTSSFWSTAKSVQDAYLKNMDLSHQRTRSVLHYTTSMLSVRSQLPWLRKHLTANGLSSAKLLYKDGGQEDFDGSQRVEFKVRTDAESKIARILELSS